MPLFNDQDIERLTVRVSVLVERDKRIVEDRNICSHDDCRNINENYEMFRKYNEEYDIYVKEKRHADASKRLQYLAERIECIASGFKKLMSTVTIFYSQPAVEIIERYSKQLSEEIGKIESKFDVSFPVSNLEKEEEGEIEKTREYLKQIASIPGIDFSQIEKLEKYIKKSKLYDERSEDLLNASKHQRRSAITEASCIFSQINELCRNAVVIHRNRSTREKAWEFMDEHKWGFVVIGGLVVVLAAGFYFFPPGWAMVAAVEGAEKGAELALAPKVIAGLLGGGGVGAFVGGAACLAMDTNKWIEANKRLEIYESRLQQKMALSREIAKKVDNYFGSETSAEKNRKIEEAKYKDLQTEKRNQLIKNAGDYALMLKDVDKDGDCFFHAFLDQIKIKSKLQKYSHYDTQQLREIAANHIMKHQELYKPFIHGKNIEEYLSEQRKSGEWADHLMVMALSHELKLTFVIISSSDSINTVHVFKQSKNNAFEDIICLGHESELHYYSLDKQIPAGSPKKSISHLIDGEEILTIGKFKRNCEYNPLKHSVFFMCNDAKNDRSAGIAPTLKL